MLLTEYYSSPFSALLVSVQEFSPDHCTLCVSRGFSWSAERRAGVRSVQTTRGLVFTTSPKRALNLLSCSAAASEGCWPHPGQKHSFWGGSNLAFQAFQFVCFFDIFTLIHSFRPNSESRQPVTQVSEDTT